MSLKYVPRRQATAEGEMPMKAWIIEEAMRYGVSESAIYNRVYRGCYPGLKVRRVNKRVVFVSTTEVRQ